MTAQEQQAGAARVELRHMTTAEQWLEALRGHAKVSPQARRQRLLLVLVALALVAMSVRVTATGVSVKPSAFVPAVVMLGLWLMMRRLTARAQQRISAGLGARRITVDGSGVCVETAHVLTRFGWPAMSRYVETRQLFLLVSADKRASCLVFLPKVSADGTDRSAELRGLLDAQLPAVRGGR
ncbi:hypothetical protein [Streptomyces sp. KLOTTS4A1]|uniref:hypothetical protein n=1 Tax=Streptomyces sp. KLOTTS4A1 TaxID=3390996 RepID=UPI0039F63C2A